ncbi:diacylglycerol kinase [Pseudomonadales bacterium]|nr:diacylglycerol kinase [Pseudomonadales bacterium]
MSNEESDKKTANIAKRRLIIATKNSIAGLTACFKSEEAFRIEVFISIVALPSIFWVAENVMEGLLLFFVIALLLLTELLNSAIEAVVDRVGMDYHPLSKRAKDIASAAVFISWLLAGITWLVLIFSN